MPDDCVLFIYPPITRQSVASWQPHRYGSGEPSVWSAWISWGAICFLSWSAHSFYAGRGGRILKCRGDRIFFWKKPLTFLPEPVKADGNETPHPPLHPKSVWRFVCHPRLGAHHLAASRVRCLEGGVRCRARRRPLSLGDASFARLPANTNSPATQ